ncbi:outer membrane lipoprotein chaperone LolA [Aurantivibrio plasticivorans]
MFSVKNFAESPAISQLSDLLSGVDSMEGSFKQTITDEENVIVEENNGQFWLKRPGNFRWEVSPPFAKTIVSDGKTLSTYDPDLEQLTIEAVNANVMESPMILLSGDVDAIHQRYTVIAKEGKHAFELTPKRSDAIFTRLNVRFVDGVLAEMTIFNTLGETQTYIFSELIINPEFKLNQFQFIPPENTDILHLAE